MIIVLLLLTIGTAASSAIEGSGNALEDEIQLDPRASIIEIDETFSSPSGMCNVTLVIGGKKLLVSKEFLAIHSPLFASLFANANEQDDVLVISDVDHDEFVSLLKVLFPGDGEISDTNVLHILKLGYRFQIKIILGLAEQHLKESNALDIRDKMLIADSYQLHKLMRHSLHSFTSAITLANLKKTSVYPSFSPALRAAIGDRMMDLVNNEDW